MGVQIASHTSGGCESARIIVARVDYGGRWDVTRDELWEVADGGKGAHWNE